MRIALKLRLFLLLILICGLQSMGSAQRNVIGQLPIHSFSPKFYKAKAQNWDIVQDERGVMYFANNGGVLIYDGERWELIRVREDIVVRSLCVDLGGKIYVGGDNQFGFFLPDAHGKLTYHSLSDSLQVEHEEYFEVWSTLIHEDKVFFQTSKQIFIIQDEKVETLQAETAYQKLFQVDGHLFLKEEGRQLKHWQDGTFKDIVAETQIKEMSSIVKRRDVYLVFTKRAGIYAGRYNEAMKQFEFTSIEKGSFKQFRETEISSACMVGNEMLTLGTWGNGLWVVDGQGALVTSIKKENGLSNDIVYTQFLDRDRNLWVATSSGISKVEIASAVSAFGDEQGLSGTIEDLKLLGEQLYVASHTGVYRLNGETKRLELIDSKTISTESWGLFVGKVDQDSALLVASNDAIYQLKGDRFKRLVSCVPWCIEATSSSKHFLVGLDDGVMLMYIEKGKWKKRKIEGISESIFNICYYKGKYWLGSLDGKCFSLEFMTNFQAETLTTYTREQGVPPGPIYLETFDDRLLFGTDDGLKVLAEDGNLVGSGFLQELGFREDLIIHRLHARDKNKLWMVTYDDLSSKYEVGYMKRKAEGDEFEWVNSSFAVISENVIHSILEDEDKVSWLGGVGGLFRYDQRKGELAEDRFDVLIRRVTLGTDSTVLWNVAGEEEHVYDYVNNSITFHFASPKYNGDVGNVYSWRLVGETEKWSKWQKEIKKGYSNLPEGHYTFEVRAKTYHGSISEVSRFSFEVLAPWYRTAWAYMGYFAVFVVVVYLITQIALRRVRAQNEKLEEIITDRTKEIVEQKEEIEKQKDLVDEQNRDIMDSIRYAQGIQNAILPADHFVQNNFEDSFVLFKPKDIVSGDFYWMEQVEGKVLFAAVDCTGHGVPGAFVSIVGNNGLNRAVNEFGLTNPGSILDKLASFVEHTFEKSENQVRDGMDMALCCLDKFNMRMEFAGANNPLWVISEEQEKMVDGEKIVPNLSDEQGKFHLYEIKADKQPIGKIDQRKPYKNSTVELAKGDACYVFSDGFADQFGGVKGKKLMKKNFKKMLLNVCDQPLAKQKQFIFNAFEDWRSGFEQVDDVCVFGVRI